jgi:hypothetical protein
MSRPVAVGTRVHLGWVWRGKVVDRDPTTQGTVIAVEPGRAWIVWDTP